MSMKTSRSQKAPLPHLNKAAPFGKRTLQIGAMAVLIAAIAALFFTERQTLTKLSTSSKSETSHVSTSAAPTDSIASSSDRPALEPTAVPIPPPLAAPEQRPAAGLDLIPKDEQASFQDALRRAMLSIDAVHPGDSYPGSEGASHMVGNERQRLMGYFLKDGGFRIQSTRSGKTWQTTFRHTLAPGTHGAWTIQENRAEYVRGTSTEWYVNRENGIEHGFTLTERPANTPEDGPVLLEMAVDELRVNEDPTKPEDLIFTDPMTDQAVIAYRDLKVWDADGHRLPASMKPSARGFMISVDDSGARYPMTVDPLIISLETAYDDGDYNAQQIAACATNGEWLAVGIPNYNANVGTVYVFQRVDGTWVKRQRIIPGNATWAQSFGASLAMSADTLVVGAPAVNMPNSNETYGKVSMYRLNSGTWSHTASRNGFPGSNLGISVAIEGTTIVAGSPGTNNASVYEWNGTTWHIATDLAIPASMASGNISFGHSVAINGGRVLVGAPNDSYAGRSTGSAFIFEKSGNLWMDPIRLRGADSAADDAFGTHVAMDGDTVAIGAPGRNFSASALDVGSIYIFTPQGEDWAQRQRLTHTGANVSDRLGKSFCLAGNRIIALTEPNGMHEFKKTTTWGPSTPISTNYPDFNPVRSIALHGNLIITATYNTIYTFNLSGTTWTIGSPTVMGLGFTNEQLGTSVAIEGNTAIIGIPFSSHYASETGMVVVLKKNGNRWEPSPQRLNHGNYVANRRFGWALAISEGVIAISAEAEDTFKGAAYIFTPNPSDPSGYTSSKISRTSGVSLDRFGFSIDIHGDRVVVGSPGCSVSNLAMAGKAVVFQRQAGTNNWLQTHEISAQAIGSFWSTVPDASAYARFGFSVAIHGSTIVVGAPHADIASPARPDAGKAYVYTYSSSGNTWSVSIPLTPEAGSIAGDWFGYSVDFDGTHVAVGASGGDGVWSQTQAGDRKGKAYIFVFSFISYMQQAVLQASPASVLGDNFGHDVALGEGGRLVVAASQIQSGGKGTAYLYQKSGTAWTQQQTISPPEITANSRFAHSVAIHGDTIVCGIPGGDTLALGENQGMAYIYRIIDPDAVIPQLSIARSGGNAILTWPATPGWTLHRSATLATGSWTPITVTTDGTYTYAMSGNPRMFFRLQKN